MHLKEVGDDEKFVAFQIMIALVIGALIGHFFPDFGMALRPIGDGFIRLIKMIVVPIVFYDCHRRSWQRWNEENGQSRIKDNHLV